jgi:hypothetical protein
MASASALGVRPPCQAGDLVNDSSISGGYGGGRELIGEHAFSFGIKSRRRARTISDKAPPLRQNASCIRFGFRG